MYHLKDYFFSAILALAFNSNDVSAKDLKLVTEYLPPLQTKEGNSISGIATDIVLKTVHSSELSYSIEIHPWSISYQRALKEPDTCIFSIARTPEREAKFHWIGNVVKPPIAFYSIGKKPISLSEVEDAKAFRLVVRKDDVTHQFVRAKLFIENKHYYAAETWDAFFGLLKTPSRNFDLTIMNVMVMSYWQQNNDDMHGFTKLLEIEELSLEHYLACHLNTKEITITKLKKTMQHLEKEGVLARLRGRKNFAQGINKNK